MIRRLSVPLLILTTAIAVGQNIPNFTLTSVPNVGLHPVAINDLGHTLGRTTINYLGHGYFWSPETGLVEIPLLPGTVSLYPKGMNNHDQVVRTCLTPTNVQVPFLWSPSTGIAAIEAPAHPNGFGAVGIDDTGHISGNFLNGGTWVLRDSGWAPIPEIDFVFYMSPGGIVCGRVGPASHIVVWKEGVVRRVYPATGYNVAYPTSINDCDQTVGYMTGGPIPDYYPALFHDTIRGTLALGRFDFPQYQNAQLTDINSSGFAVGSEYRTSYGRHEPHAFTTSTGYTSLVPNMGSILLISPYVSVNSWSQILLSTTTGSAIATPIPGPAPTISSITPASVEAGNGDLMLRIDGSNFSAISSGRLDDANALTTVTSQGVLMLLVDGSALKHAGTHSIRVQDGRQLSNEVQLTVLPILRHPVSLTLNQGTIINGGLASVIASDDQYLEGGYSWIGPRGEPNFGVDVRMSSLPVDVEQVDVSAEVSSVAGSSTVKLDGFDTISGQWVLLGSDVVGGQDVVLTASVSQNASRFVSQAGEMNVRISFFAGPDSGRSARGRIDCIEATVFP